MFFDQEYENQHDFDQWPHTDCGCGQLTIYKLTFATSLNLSCNGLFLYSMPGLGFDKKLDESNKGHQLLKKMGWSGNSNSLIQ